VFWGPKAEAFARARAIDAAFLADPALEYLHASYPPLLTNVYALATMSAGRLSWLAATATFPTVLAALALGVHGVLRLRTNAARAAVATAVVVAGLGLLGNEADVAGNAEMPLLLFEALAMSLLIVPAASRPSVQRLVGVLLGGAACTKVEGLAFAIAAVALFLGLRRGEPPRWRAALRLSAPAVVGVGLWLAYGIRYRLFFGYRGYGEVEVLHWDRLGTALGAIGASLWRIGYGLPFLSAAALLLVGRRPSVLVWLPVGTAAVLALFFVFTYLHQADATLWIGWSAARIFSPLVPLLAIGSVAAAREEASAT
jgi:hypothetical protein